MGNDKFQTIRRGDAAKLLDKILVELANAANGGADSNDRALVAIDRLVRQFKLELPSPCRGEAHSNPHIDNCGVCAPRWGFTGPKVRVT